MEGTRGRGDVLFASCFIAVLGGFLTFSPTRLRYGNLSFVVKLDTMGLRRISNDIRLHYDCLMRSYIIGKSYDIVRQSNDGRTIVVR